MGRTGTQGRGPAGSLTGRHPSLPDRKGFHRQACEPGTVTEHILKSVFNGFQSTEWLVGSHLCLIRNNEDDKQVNGKRKVFSSGIARATVKKKKKKRKRGTSLELQWLRIRTSTAGGAGLIPGRGTEILHAAAKK